MTHIGENSVEADVGDSNKLTHSHTGQYAITVSGRLLPKVFWCLQEPKGEFGPRDGQTVQKLSDEFSTVYVTCSRSGKLNTQLYAEYIKEVLEAHVSTNYCFSYRQLGWTNKSLDILRQFCKRIEWTYVPFQSYSTWVHTIHTTMWCIFFPTAKLIYWRITTQYVPLGKMITNYFKRRRDTFTCTKSSECTDISAYDQICLLRRKSCREERSICECTSSFFRQTFGKINIVDAVYWDLFIADSASMWKACNIFAMNIIPNIIKKTWTK